MIAKDFWSESTVAVMGAGSWGTVLATLLAKNCREVRLWCREEAQARAMNATRVNAKYLPEMELDGRIRVLSDPVRLFEGNVRAVVWALPSHVCRTRAREMAGFFRGDEVVLHATKGVERDTLKRVSEILKAELPCARVGVISGPNLAHEIARGDPSATVVASVFDEVVEAGRLMFGSSSFRVYGSHDVIGVEWAGALKNILALAGGALDALKFGWNARAMLITRGLAEMVRFGKAMGGQDATFLGLAGLGDLMATSGSSLSRNYRTGYQRAQGASLEKILTDLGGVAEGVRMAAVVHEAAERLRIPMPMTEGIHKFLLGEVEAKEALHGLMVRPTGFE